MSIHSRESETMDRPVYTYEMEFISPEKASEFLARGAA